MYSDTVSSIIKDYNNRLKLFKNPQDVIKLYNLKLLPENEEHNLLLGRSFLIKNNSIIEINSTFTKDLETDESLKEYNFYWSDKKLYHVIIITMHNIYKSDLNAFRNPNPFLGSKEMISFSIEKLESFIKAMKISGFSCYRSVS